MVETGVNSFATPSDIGPLYPFVGTEVILVVIGILLWIGWHILHVRSENKEFEEASELYRQVGLERAMHSGGGGKLASEEEIRVAEVQEALHEEHRNTTLSPKERREEVTQRDHDKEEKHRSSNHP